MPNKTSKVLQWLDDTQQPKNEILQEHIRKSYDTKIVAWLDILGIRARIKNESKYDAESIFYIMESLSTYVRSACDNLAAEGKINYLQIADGFMLVADIACATQLCSILAEIQWRIFIELKMLSRGAVTAGNVSISDNAQLIIGPAYVDAYVMESENAIFPRIIISEAFLSETKESIDFAFLREDSDKVMYIDFIDYIMSTQVIEAKRLKKIIVEQGMKSELEKNYVFKKDTNFTVYQKYGWVITLLKRNKINILSNNSGRCKDV